MGNTKVAFFFGAGAEGRKNYDIVTGTDFLKASLYGEGVGDYRGALSECFSGKYFGGKYEYSKEQLAPSSLMIKNIVIEKLRRAPTDITGFSADIAAILNIEDIIELKGEKDSGLSGESYKLIESIEKIKKRGGESKVSGREKEFSSIIREDRDYDSITDALLRRLFAKNKNGKCDINTQIGIGGFMDSYFHTIIDPPKYSNIRFSKIFNYYWACYFVVLRDILKLFPTLVSEYFKGATIDCGKILTEHHLLTERLYRMRIPKKDSYYEAIVEYLRRKGNNSKLAGVLTTNYFHLAEKVLEGRIEHEVAYLNGQLKWMERPEMLEVYDLEKMGQIVDLYFPFIFGQSMTKPIVHINQIEEFHKAKVILDEADCVIILGYGINEDDNHVNSLLHEFLNGAGKRIIVITNDQNIDYAKRLKVGSYKVEKRVYDYCKTSAKMIINEVLDSVY